MSTQGLGKAWPCTRSWVRLYHFCSDDAWCSSADSHQINKL